MSGDLSQEKVVITAGATREEIDPVRFISNYSSGKMGFALAEIACVRGANVVLIAGATTAEPPAGVRIVRAFSAEAMHRRALEEIAAATIFIAAAAVADYRPVRRANDKIKKSGGNLILELEPTPDILADVSRRRHAQLIVAGFAAETTNVLAHARTKLAGKNLDLIVANNVSEKDSGFGAETSRVTILRRDKENQPLELPLLAKTKVASRILDEILVLRRELFPLDSPSV